MKRLFYLFLVAAAAFVGCTNDDDSGLDCSGEAVSFSVMELTRSAETKEAWKNGDQFAIFEEGSQKYSKCYEMLSATDLTLTAAAGVEPFYITSTSSSNEYLAFYPYIAGWSYADYQAAIATNFNEVDFISSGDNFSTNTTFDFSHKQSLLTFTFLAGLEFSNGFDALTVTLTIGNDVEIFEFSDLGGVSSYTFSTLVNTIATNDFGTTAKSFVAVGYDNSGVVYPCYMDFTTSNTITSTSIDSWEAGGNYSYDYLAVGTFDIFYKLATDTYEIYTAAGLKAFANLVNGTDSDAGAHYAGFDGFSSSPQAIIDGKLMEDIDLVTVCSKDNGSWIPIGNNDTSGNSAIYKGEFDGNGKVVKNLYIDSDSDYQGLFGYTYKNTNTGTNAKISNLGVVNGSVKGNFYVGGVVGYAQNSSISDCYNTATVDGVIDVGGVVGYAVGEITNCYNTGDVKGSKLSVGGVAGKLNYSAVSDCYNTGNIENYGDIDGGSYTGGVVGEAYNNTTVTKCYNTGDVKSSYESVGGVVGYLYTNSKVSDCYNTGNVESSYRYVGGVVGKTSSVVTSCYSCGAVSGSSNIGGVVGIKSSGDITNCYYDNQTVGEGVTYNAPTTAVGDTADDTENNVTGLSTAYMTGGTLLSYLQNGDLTIWAADTGINNGYPILVWQTSANE